MRIPSLTIRYGPLNQHWSEYIPVSSQGVLGDPGDRRDGGVRCSLRCPAFAAPAPDMYGPTISDVETTSEGLGGSVSFVVEDIPGLSSIDLRDPSTDAIFYRRVVDFPGNVSADGVHRYTFDIKFSDIQAAWTKAGHTDALPATVKLVAWGSDGLPSKRADVALEPVAMTSLDFGIESGKLDLRVGQQTNIGVTHQPENANKTKINWSGDDIDVLNVDEKSGLVTAQKEG